jgi:hypothetical protein
MWKKFHEMKEFFQIQNNQIYQVQLRFQDKSTKVSLSVVIQFHFHYKD